MKQLNAKDTAVVSGGIIKAIDHVKDNSNVADEEIASAIICVISAMIAETQGTSQLKSFFQTMADNVELLSMRGKMH